MSRRRWLIAASIAGACGCASTPVPPGRDPIVLVGVAAVDITPDEPIRLTGYGNRSTPAAVVGQRLWAKALAFGGDGRPAAVLITADLIAVPRHVTEDVATRLRAAGLARERIAVSATHTHTGPSLSGVLPHIFSVQVTPEEQAVIDRYTKQLPDKLARAAADALANRQPSRVAWGRGTVAFAAHRRVVKDGKWVAFGVDPKGPVDRDLSALIVRGKNDAVRAVLVNYACHATTLDGSDNFVHGDWPGSAAALVQQRHPGSVAMVTIGAGADANPDPRGHGTPDVDRHATAVATEVDRLLGTALRRVGAPPDGQLRDIELSFSQVPGREHWQTQAARSDPAGSLARAMLQRLDRGEAVPMAAPFTIQTWTFGRDLAMVFLAGEVVSEYGLRLKREVDGDRLWVNAYSNDVPFYVASRRMIAEGGYEVDRSMVFYGHPAPLAAATEDHVIGAVREMLPAAFSRR